MCARPDDGAAARKLVDSVDGYTSELVQLQNRLDPGKARKAMRRFGIRALKWPFDSKEVSDIVSNLERGTLSYIALKHVVHRT